MSDGRQRLSGSEYRKRKAEKDAKIKKQAGAIKKFFQQSTSQELTSNSGTSQVQETSFETSLSTDNLRENIIELDALRGRYPDKRNCITFERMRF